MRQDRGHSAGFPISETTRKLSIENSTQKNYRYFTANLACTFRLARTKLASHPLLKLRPSSYLHITCYTFDILGTSMLTPDCCTKWRSKHTAIFIKNVSIETQTINTRTRKLHKHRIRARGSPKSSLYMLISIEVLNSAKKHGPPV